RVRRGPVEGSRAFTWPSRPGVRAHRAVPHRPVPSGGDPLHHHHRNSDRHRRPVWLLCLPRSALGVGLRGRDAGGRRVGPEALAPRGGCRDAWKRAACARARTPGRGGGAAGEGSGPRRRPPRSRSWRRRAPLVTGQALWFLCLLLFLDGATFSFASTVLLLHYGRYHPPVLLAVAGGASSALGSSIQLLLLRWILGSGQPWMKRFAPSREK